MVSAIGIHANKSFELPPVHMAVCVEIFLTTVICNKTQTSIFIEERRSVPHRLVIFKKIRRGQDIGKKYYKFMSMVGK